MDYETKSRLRRLSKEARRLRRKYRGNKSFAQTLEEVQAELKKMALEITGKV